MIFFHFNFKYLTSIIIFFTLLIGCSARPTIEHRRHSQQTPQTPMIPRTQPNQVTQNPELLKKTQDSSFLKEAQQQSESGHFLNAFQILTLLPSDVSEEESLVAREKALEILETRLGEIELRHISQDSRMGLWRAQATFQLGRIARARNELSPAKSYFSSVIALVPGTDLAQKAEHELALLQRIRQVEPRTIGAILPLSGRSAAIGQRALRGIQMGLGLHEPGSPYKLAVVDSEGSPDQARRAVERLVVDDNVIGIIGGLLSRTVLAEANKANDLNIPFIALSQRPGITQIGPTIFRNSISSEMITRELVHTAMNTLGLRRFALLYPNDSYGIEYANAFWDEVHARGGVITAVQIYNPAETDFRDVAQRLVGTWYTEGREEEYKLIVRERLQQERERPSRNRRGGRQDLKEEDVLPPRVDFEAIFIPDSARMMTQLTAFLSYVGVRNVKVLGTNLWSQPNLSKRAGLFGDHLIYVDERLPNTETSHQSKFVSDFKDVFQDLPGPIEIQAFDSALIFRALIGQGTTSREDLTKRLSSIQGFPGSMGPLSVSPQQEFLRPLVSIGYQKGQPLILRKSN